MSGAKGPGVLRAGLRGRSGGLPMARGRGADYGAYHGN